LQDIALAGISQRDPEPLHNPLLADLRSESVWGQSRRFDNRPVTSGLPPTSDMSLHPTK